ncbi:hypothetical protein CRYUN_Cryun27aG0032200 [Craigia yunnanensis]
MDHAADAHRSDLMTITRFVLNEQSKYPESRGDFTILLNHIVLGCKLVLLNSLDLLGRLMFRQCILVSEEDEEATFVEPSKRGSGQLNVFSFIWIFGIYMVKVNHEPTLDDVLQPGKHMLAAGYCMYGSSCTLVLSTGGGVNGFTLDPSLGEFILTHPDIKIPKKGKIYSVNEGNAKNWDGPTANLSLINCDGMNVAHRGSTMWMFREK